MRPGDDGQKGRMRAMINIDHLSKADVLAALFNNARTQGMGVIHYKPHHRMSREEAESLLEKCGDYAVFDYLEGRVMKVDLRKDGLDPTLYDRDNGKGAAQCAIEELEDRLTRPEGVEH